MKKVLLTFVLIALAIPSFAQRFERANKFNVSVMGGPMLSKNENSFGYGDFKVRKDLLTWQGQVAVGYSFTNAISGRVSIGYGKNPSAMNIRESGWVFAPYDFKSVTFFADAMVNLNGLGSDSWAFAPKIYVGLGAGHTSGFSTPYITKHMEPANAKGKIVDDPGTVIHPKYNKAVEEGTFTDSNTSFGMRAGFIAEYDFKSGFGIFVDLCAEAFSENFNGQHKLSGSGKGKNDFPFDVRGTASLGVIMHF